MNKLSGYGLACRLLSIFLILFQSSCALSPQTRDQLNAGSAVTSATFNPQIGGYCTPGLGDIVDATTLKLSSLAPNTYCLLDNFGVDRTVVLAMVEKYDGATSIDDAQAEDIENSLHVFALIDKIAELQQQQGAAQASIQYPIRVASLYDFPLPTQMAAVASPTTMINLLTLSLAVWFYIVPGEQKYNQDHPSFGLKKSSPDYEERKEVRAQIIASAKEDIVNELCKNLACQTVAVTDETVTGGTCPPNSSCPPPDCTEIEAQIYGRVSDIRDRYYEMLADVHELYPARPNRVEPYGSWPGHQWIYRQRQKELAPFLRQAESLGCAVPDDAEEWATKPPPSQPGRG